jgi:signal transduction histidine kinase
MKEGQRLNFRINTYLKDLIGRELLTNKYAAVFELLKNSYDAGATNAWVRFNPDKAGTKIESIAIIDNGSGMNKDDIETKWMNVAKSYKRDDLKEMQRTGQQLRKIPVGRKGIGRFSCDKLGETLDLYTRTNAEQPWLHLVLDWAEFQKAPDKDFQEIGVTLFEEEESPPFSNKIEHGTTLLIGGLRERWDYSSVLSLKRYFQKLLDPVSPTGQGAFNITIEAPSLAEEEKRMKAKNPSDGVNGLVHSTLFQDLEKLAVKISISLRSGRLTTILLDKGERLYKLEERVDDLKFIEEIDADVFFLDKYSKGVFTRRVGIEPVKYGSIFLYRNGVRVFPYGEPNDDWLGLNRRKAQGYRRYLSSRELFGRVSLTDLAGNWEEVSSRDSGIKDSDARDELTDFIHKRIILKLEKYVVEASEWKDPRNIEQKAERNAKVIEFLAGISVNDKNVISVDYSSSLTDAVREKAAYGSLAAIEDLSRELDPEKRKAIARSLVSFKSSLEALKAEAAEAEEEAIFLKSVSGDVKRGTLILIAEHNINIIARRLAPALKNIGNYARSNSLPKKFSDEIEYAITELELMRERNKLILRANLDITRKSDIDIPLYVEQYIEQFWTRSLQRAGIALEVAKGNLHFKKEVFPEVLSLVLDNLIDNSKKAGSYNIRISFAERDGRLVMRFVDDGKGIGEGEIESLFKPWSSGTAGSGIGLYMIKKVLKEHGGSIRFTGNSGSAGFNGASFEVEI